jgi:anti-anti-sigma factor
VDLDEVTFLDSSGVAVLLLARRLALAAGGGCLIQRASPQIIGQLGIAGLTQLFGLRGAERRQR